MMKAMKFFAARAAISAALGVPAALGVSAAIAAPGPSCADQIVADQALLDTYIARNGQISSWRVESRAARMHFQPTPETLAAAEKAPNSVLIANDLLEKAREADYRNDTDQCFALLKQAEDALKARQ